MLDAINNILLINHPDHTERLDYQKQQLGSYSLSFTIIDSVIVHDSIGFSNKAIKSCALSHLKALEYSLRFKDELCLILEDDSRISNINGLNSFINHFLSKRLDWDMLYFFPSGHKNNAVTEIDELIIQNTKSIPSHAYVVNPTRISFMIDKLRSYFLHLEETHNRSWEKSLIDHILAQQIHPEMSIYSCKNHLIFQYRELFGSTLGWGLEYNGKSYPMIRD